MGVQKCCGQESCTENDLPPKNDRRCQLINEIKQMIGDFEHQEKAKPRQSRRPDQGVPGMRDLEDECRQWRKRKECPPPTITAIALHETRPTSDYSNMRHENSSQVTYVDATKEGQEWRKTPPAPWDLPRTPSQELRAGTLYQNCQCLKRNGLQHDCPRWECGGRPECVAVNPGPCCQPSQGLKPIRGDRRPGNKSQAEKSTGEAPGYGGKQLKTGPLNPEICIPIGTAQQQQGPQGSGQGAIGFIAGVPNNRQQMTQTLQQPRHEVVMVLDLSQVSPGNQGRQAPQSQGPSQGGTPSGGGVSCYCSPVQSAPGGFQGRPPPSTPQNQGGTPSGAGVSCYCRPVDIAPTGGSPGGFPGRQPQQTPQSQGSNQGIILTGPGVTCCCRPVQEPPSGGAGRIGIIGIPMTAAPLIGN